MIAVDTNVLVYAHRDDSPHHAPARAALTSLISTRRSWAVPWPCLHEFLAIVTHPRIYRPPADIATAIGAVNDLLSLPGATTIAEATDHLRIMEELTRSGTVVGPRIHDARIAAICLGHGVTELWTADRDFSYFPGLLTRNPLVG
jgi:toxin-antitoxin system PIN domain toxin